MSVTRFTLWTALAALVGCSHIAPVQPGDQVLETTNLGTDRRTPAEWEPQAAVWLQWPQAYEGARIQDSFVAIVEVLAPRENVHLVANNAATERRGRAALAHVSGSITWHQIDNDSSWMRDNGPRYVEVDGALVLQNWEFDAWGGGFGAVPYAADNALPDRMATMLDLPLEQVRLIHERGDLEVNGTDTAMVSWSVMSHRNPGMTKEAVTAAFQEALGVTSVIYIEGFDPEDGTRGHVDGMARFISEDTIVVGDDGTALMDDAAAQIKAQRPDLIVERMAVPLYSPYLNWLVGDGFVLTGSTGVPAQDAAARADIERYFPGRSVHFVDVDALWNNGGGVHCVTNDQPEG